METRWGKLLGRYEVVAELGRGAMGVVYKARDPKIDRFVAVKTISLLGQDEAAEREYRGRFFQEAQAAGRLLHPGIVTVFDVGEDPESRDPYIVMEYVVGQALDGLLSGQGGTLPLNSTLRLTQEVAEALDYAHAQGVVHRDIKPANILITTEGHAKITDFGIAKLNCADRTLPGRALGSPAYMSPEQLNGEPVDGRSDLFSLGVILYSMSTGYRPFQGSGVTTVCFKVANHVPLAPTALNPDLPPGVDAVVARAMAKDPAQRYQRGIELALDLRELQELYASQRYGNAQWHKTRLRTSMVHESNPAARGSSSSLLGVGLADGSGKRFRIRARKSMRFFGPFAKRASAIWMITFSVSILALGLLVLDRPLPRGKSITSAAATELPSGDGGSPEEKQASRELRPAQDPGTGKERPKRSSLERVALSSLDIRVECPFTAARLSVWVDKELIYSHPLHGATKKRFILFGSAQRRESMTLPVAAGKHDLRVRVQSTAEGYDEQQRIPGSFAKGSEKTLLISFGGQHKDMRVALE
jgi:serine/threonine protein kinase